MIDLNATLLFQAAHFAIAYVLLTKLLFEPALAAIYAHEHALHDAVARLKALRKTIEGNELKQRSFLAQVRSYFARHAPEKQHKVTESTSTLQQVAADEPSAQITQETKKKLTHLFVSSWDSHDT